MTDYLHLTIPEESDEADEIRSIDAHNDLERLKIWAGEKVRPRVEENVKEDLKKFIESQFDRLEVDQRSGEIELV